MTRESGAAALPSWLERPNHRLTQLITYLWKVYRLPTLLARIREARQQPRILLQQILGALTFGALLRVPSLNALEGYLREPGFQKLLGEPPQPGRKLMSADTVARILDGLNLNDLVQQHGAVLRKAERNKVFREGSYGGLRCVALDGWEPFGSRHRHCEACLTRKITTQEGTATEFFHRFVIALLLGPTVEVVLDLEPLRSQTLRHQLGEATATGDEGEAPAARRLLEHLHQRYGAFIDLVVLDGLYPTGPVMSLLTELGYGAVITLRKETDEPLKEALALWKGQPPASQWSDPQRGEQVSAWDAPGLCTLETYAHPIRAVRAQVRSLLTQKSHTWCAAVIGPKAQRLSLRTILQIQRARWHEENTAFHQWSHSWNLSHVFHHTPQAIRAVLWLWTLAFNLLQLFLYKRLRRPRVPRDPSDTIRHLVETLRLHLTALVGPVPWAFPDVPDP
jgi:hypothetical protein